ncbi:DUF6193 family natural product biosynthesis protein [Streptomyces vinaceus]|uniref:DUF6193 family natural product biosynthesis protein n=1 Tax=Streptomyces vinaceus TaxID=1960 RepID=UPI003687A94F
MNPSESSGPVDSSDDDPRLRYYADLVDFGGLQPAISSIARDRHIDLGVATEIPEAQNWSTARFTSPRGDMRVQLGHGVRRFALTLDSGRGYVWASGSTTDLPQVVEVMSVWRGGVKLRELGGRFPFMEFDRMSQAHEDGNPVETQWEIITGDDDFLRYRELLLALHADPDLRQTFPFFSHWTLRLAKDHNDADADQILLRRRQDDDVYTLWSSSDPEQRREFRSLDELVRAAAALLAHFRVR